MLVVQCLLAVIAIILIVGIAVISAGLDKVIQNQAIIVAQQQRNHKALMGEYSDGLMHDISRDLGFVAEFARDARRGYIPNLRYDDWHATKVDLQRWEHAAILAAANP